ncbi:MAG: hypothetical protein WC414_03385 [Patescibacteria group bacterium]
MYLLVLQRILLSFIWDFFYFPLWWYSSGTKKAIIYCYHFFECGNEFLAPWIWLKNIFVPMFGQYDFQGRLVSFFVRFFNVFFRLLALFFWFWFVLLLFILWFILPIFVFFMFYISVFKK